MSTDHAKLGHLFAEIVSGHHVSRFDEIVAPGYVNHNPFAEPGLQGVKKVFGAIIAGVPDLKVFAEDVFVSADGMRVVGRYRYEGTHTGNFLGCPATGNAFAMRSIDIWLVRTDASSSTGTSSTHSTSSARSVPCSHLASRRNAANPAANKTRSKLPCR
jgi:predicted ester cyclase